MSEHYNSKALYEIKCQYCNAVETNPSEKRYNQYKYFHHIEDDHWECNKCGTLNVGRIMTLKSIPIGNLTGFIRRAKENNNPELAGALEELSKFSETEDNSYHCPRCNHTHIHQNSKESVSTCLNMKSDKKCNPHISYDSDYQNYICMNCGFETSDITEFEVLKQ